MKALFAHECIVQGYTYLFVNFRLQKIICRSASIFWLTSHQMEIHEYGISNIYTAIIF